MISMLNKKIKRHFRLWIIYPLVISMPLPIFILIATLMGIDTATQKNIVTTVFAVMFTPLFILTILTDILEEENKRLESGKD